MHDDDGIIKCVLLFLNSCAGYHRFNDGHCPQQEQLLPRTKILGQENLNQKLIDVYPLAVGEACRDLGMLKVLAPVEMRILNEEELLKTDPIIAPDGYIPNSVVRKQFKLLEFDVPAKPFQPKPVPEVNPDHMPATYGRLSYLKDCFRPKRQKTDQPVSQSRPTCGFIDVQKSPTNLSEPSRATKAEKKLKPVTPTTHKYKSKRNKPAQLDLEDSDRARSGVKENSSKVTNYAVDEDSSTSPVTVSPQDVHSSTSSVKISTQDVHSSTIHDKKPVGPQVFETRQVLRESTAKELLNIPEKPVITLELLNFPEKPVITLELYSSKPDEEDTMKMLAEKLWKPDDLHISHRIHNWLEYSIPALFEENREDDDPLWQEGSRYRKEHSIMSEGQSWKIEGLHPLGSKGSASTFRSQMMDTDRFSPTTVGRPSNRKSRRSRRLTPCNPNLYKYYDKLNTKLRKQAEQIRRDTELGKLNHAPQSPISYFSEAIAFVPVEEKMLPRGDGQHRMEPVPGRIAIYTQNELRNGIYEDERIRTTSRSLTNQLSHHQCAFSLHPPSAKESRTDVFLIKKKYDIYRNLDQLRLNTSPRRQRTHTNIDPEVTSKPLHKPYEITESIESFMKKQSLPKPDIVMFPMVKFHELVKFY